MAFRILQLSDSHLFSDPEKVGYENINPRNSLDAVLKGAVEEKPDLILFTGDVSGDDSTESYAHLRDMLNDSALTSNIRMIPGNHDDPASMCEIFSSDICRVDGFEDFGCWRLHYLNSHHRGTQGSVSSQRLEQLEKAVLDAPSRHHIIAVHHHPLDCIHWMDKHDWVDRSNFLQLMHLLPRPIRVIYGHVHHDYHRVFNGQEYYSCPSTCWQWALTEAFGVSDLPPGYRMIELGDNGEWLTWVNRVTVPAA